MTSYVPHDTPSHPGLRQVPVPIPFKVVVVLDPKVEDKDHGEKPSI
jgi:hypothetical protein